MDVQNRIRKEVELERQLKALANRRRLMILGFLRKHKEASVGEVAAAIRLSFTSTSKHLNILERANFVEKEQRSLQVFYQTAPQASGYLPNLFARL